MFYTIIQLVSLNLLKNSQHKTKKIIFPISVCQKFRSDLAGWLWLTTSHVAEIKSSQDYRLRASLVGGSTSKMAHSHNFWQEALPYGCLLIAWQLTPQSEGSKSKVQDACCDLVTRVTYLYFHRILFFRSKMSILTGERIKFCLLKHHRHCRLQSIRKMLVVGGRVEG